MESKKSDVGEVLGGEVFVLRRGGMAVTAMVNFTPESGNARRRRVLQLLFPFSLSSLYLFFLSPFLLFYLLLFALLYIYGRSSHSKVMFAS